MSWTKFTLAIFLLIPASWTRVSRLNDAIDLASESYSKAEYEQSITNHQALIDQFQYSSSALDYNLGLSNQYAEKPDEASAYYDQVTTSPDKTLASFAFNQSGVILGNKEEYEAALSKFKSALIKDPNNEVARYNYEMLARWLQRDEERKNQDEDKPEPSDFAKRKKAEADRMVEQFRFRDAFNLMNEALQQDETVAAYQQFMTSLQEITEIDEK
ncbi:hypothetical protein PBT90_09745 [Algoriphagus halophytocola]|uniref:Tetratricopeptide repeat protein n=1 Tax=Algoriphagus halophytocola TaxID=2991499 RepID=A0ABY6MIQ7_9BACT|nr:MULTISPECIES: hypothetical protein [unclassified Algoriphagus]UZD23672.1 hypothetical protein OM944_04075 [Algoriphagus sp. TR-M5]WBL44965.1 hypothetical protein PBT90_09745 [Algoriphagus sp. TR-M9]